MRKNITQRIKDHNMARNHFDDDIVQDKQVSFGTFLFCFLLALVLGVEIEGYRCHKQLKKLKIPAYNCTIKDITTFPKNLPTYTTQVDNIKELEVFINGKA